MGKTVKELRTALLAILVLSVAHNGSPAPVPASQNPGKSYDSISAFRFPSTDRQEGIEVLQMGLEGASSEALKKLEQVLQSGLLYGINAEAVQTGLRFLQDQLEESNTLRPDTTLFNGRHRSKRDMCRGTKSRTNCRINFANLKKRFKSSKSTNGTKRYVGRK